MKKGSSVKDVPGMLAGTLAGLAIWLPTQMVGPSIIVGVALGVGWDMWRRPRK